MHAVSNFSSEAARPLGVAAQVPDGPYVLHCGHYFMVLLKYHLILKHHFTLRPLGRVCSFTALDSGIVEAFDTVYIYYPHMPIGMLWIYRLLFVFLFFCPQEFW